MCSFNRRRSVRVALIVALGAAWPAAARAELVFFASGRSMSVKSYQESGDSLVLALRTGGQVVVDRSAVVRITPDEVPYPEPEDLAGIVADTAAVAPFAEIIDRVSAEQGVPAKLVRAVIAVESAYQQRARSRKGAMGLMQLMPDTARQYGVVDPYEPRSNIEGGVKYLKSLLDRFELRLALAAYNAGEAAVRRFGGIPPYPETLHYVDSVLRAVNR
jgi:soluble lytic murein transglycosylase-like protein